MAVCQYVRGLSLPHGQGESAGKCLVMMFCDTRCSSAWSASAFIHALETTRSLAHSASPSIYKVDLGQIRSKMENRRSAERSDEAREEPRRDCRT